MKNSSWTTSEIKQLFGEVEECKANSQPLNHAFNKHALTHGRKIGSVRNFYYQTLRKLESNKKVAQELGIILDKHKKIVQKPFSEEETSIYINKIDEMIRAGSSLRTACYKLANGNAKEMLRFQNKYRSVKKNVPNNVITMPKRKTGLSDSEINSLFMGLVKLIKKCALEQADEKLGYQVETANNALRKTITQLATKQREIDSLKQSFEILKNEKNILKNEIGKLRSENASFLSGKKISSLQKFVGELKKEQKLESPN